MPTHRHAGLGTSSILLTSRGGSECWGCAEIGGCSLTHRSLCQSSVTSADRLDHREQPQGGERSRESLTLDLIGVSNLGLKLTSLPTDEAYAIECTDLLRHDPSAAPFPLQSLLLPPPIETLRILRGLDWEKLREGPVDDSSTDLFFFPTVSLRVVLVPVYFLFCCHLTRQWSSVSMKLENLTLI